MVTKQERAGNYVFKQSVNYIKTYRILLILTVLRDKVRPFSAQYGTCTFVSKYGTIPFFKGRLATLNSSDARTSILRIFELSYRGTFLIADVTLTLIFSSLFTASTTASMQYFTVSESVKGLFFFAKKQTRREDAAALSWAVQDPHHGSTTPVVRLLNSVK